MKTSSHRLESDWQKIMMKGKQKNVIFFSYLTIDMIKGTITRSSIEMIGLLFSPSSTCFGKLTKKEAAEGAEE